MASFNISNDGSIGALYNAAGDIHITNVSKPATPQQPPAGIRFQVADPVASFRGRQAQLESVQRAFEEQNNMEPYNLVAVCGYGGIGKTELARKFIQNLRANLNIIWIYSEFESTLSDSFYKLKEELKERGYHCSVQQDVYKHLDNPECLFVFDNVENKKSIAKYLPQQRNNSLFLITSQYRTWSPHESIELNKLHLKSAVRIIRGILGTHKIKITKRQLQQLLNSLEPIPLVLQIGVGFVCQEVLDLKIIGKAYNIDNIIGELSAECELVTLEFPPFDQNLYEKSVLDALRRTLEKFWNKEDKVSKTAKNMLGVAAYFDADRIEEDILQKILNMKDEKIFNKSLTTLVQFSLFQKSDCSYKSSYTMHRTVQECVRHLCRNESKPNQCYLRALHVCVMYVDVYYAYWRHQELVIQHAEKDFETFSSFYEGNKCKALYETLARYISCNVLQLMLDKTDLINESEFLCAAVESVLDDLIEKLLEHGADFNVMNSDGLGALYYACYWDGSLDKILERIESLIKVGANINLQNSKGNSVLHSLCNVGKNCSEKDVDIFARCALMIKAGGDPTIKNSAGETAADLAQEHGLPRTRRLLEEVVSGCRCVPHIVARCKLFDFLSFSINFDMLNFDEQDESGNTLLHVLAGLDPLPAEEQVNEFELPCFTALLMSSRKTDLVAVKNNLGETAADVAARAHRMQLADMFHAYIADHIIYDAAVYRQQIEHFSFVSRQDKEHVNDRDVNGGTLLHALCRLDAHVRAHLELDVVKLVEELVVEYEADVSIRDNAGDVAADVARSRGWRLLADFLIGVDPTVHKFEGLFDPSIKLMYVAVKHRQFDLIKFAYWRYFYTLKSDLLYMLQRYEDLTDTDIISALNLFDIYKPMSKYDEDEYQQAIDAANKCDRIELANWLITVND